MLKTAFRFLVYDKPKTIGALLGVIIANFLIGQQSGIFIFLTNGMGALVDNINTDIWVVDESTTNVNALSYIDKRVLYEVQSIDGIESAHPLLIAGGSAKFQNGKAAGVQIIGSAAPYFVGGPWKIQEGAINDLSNEYTFSYDYFDTKTLGDSKLGDYFELNGKQAKFGLMTKGVRGFGATYLFTTIEKARYYSGISTDKVSAVLLKLKPGSNPQQVVADINYNIKNVRAWMPSDFSLETKKTILGSSGIAISTGMLIIFAIISGIVIIGLTLYSSAVDRIKDYATLKAIGANNGYVRKLIFIQAIIIAIIGFTIGQFLVEGFRNGLASKGAIFIIPYWLRIIYLAITLLISLGGAMFAISRITKAEPASVFRT